MNDPIDKTGRFKWWKGEESRHPSLGNILTIIGMLGGLVGVWTTLAADNRETKTKVDQLERRQIEDRTEQKRDVREVKQDVKTIDQNVQTILRKIEAMDARDRERERRDSTWRRAP